MKRLKGLLIGCLLVVLAVAFDKHLFHEENKMRKVLAWVVIVALLIIVVRIVSAQAFVAMQNQCSPTIVEWQKDSLQITSFGCTDFRRDSLIIIPHLVNGEALDKLVVLKHQVRSITLLQAAQKATLRREASIPP